MATEQQAVAAISANPFKYSNRIILKTILEREDGGLGLVGERVVIGGWIKSSKEVRKEPEKLLTVVEKGGDVGPKDVTCTEILQSRIPFIRSIVRVFGGSSYPVHDKLELVASKPPPQTIAFLKVGDGSSPTTLQVP